MSSRPPAVSVIVPAWGVAHLVGEALASLQRQTFGDWEAIVVDDGAPDDVAGAVAPFSAVDPRIRFLATEHGGISAARNRAMTAARAPIVALLDGDDAYEPEYLARMVALILADPDRGFVCCDATFMGGSERDGELYSKYASQAGEPTLEAVLARRFHVFTAVVARKEALAQVGGWDEALPAGEDLDLWLRMLGEGWRAAYLPLPLVRYRRRAASLSASGVRINRATLTVYGKAVARLGDRPEARVARAMIPRMREETAWAEGEELIVAGRTRAGLALLRAAQARRRSTRWRCAMALFRVAPFLAKPMIARRLWRPPA
ncbi:glycosyltransferase family 2 protein [Sphingomonas sp.]|uniref:glycosyltransferase family 2 protein n=1 Tax=Sphingomonas sp. TaxID=28214 RepID=UPI003AFFDC8A